MSYEQSLKNIETLKNLVLPLDGHQVFFDFSNQTDFKMLLIKNVDSDSIAELIRQKFIYELPVAKISVDPSAHEILHYEDGLVSYIFDFTSQETKLNELKKGSRKLSSIEHKIKLKNLLLKLKKL